MAAVPAHDIARIVSMGHFKPHRAAEAEAIDR